MILFMIREWDSPNEGHFPKHHTHRYAATRGLLFSHMGWILFKPTYEKLESIEKEDLINDPGTSIFD